MVIKKNKKENFYHLTDNQISNNSCIISNDNDEIFLPPNREPWNI